MPCNLHLGLQIFRQKFACIFHHPPTPTPTHPPWFDRPNNIWWRVQIVQLLIVQSFSASCHCLSWVQILPSAPCSQTPLTVSILVLRAVTPCGLVARHQRFGQTYCLHLQPTRRYNLENQYRHRDRQISYPPSICVLPLMWQFKFHTKRKQRVNL
jgi:hypothetical protein